MQLAELHLQRLAGLQHGLGDPLQHRVTRNQGAHPRRKLPDTVGEITIRRQKSLVLRIMVEQGRTMILLLSGLTPRCEQIFPHRCCFQPVRRIRQRCPDRFPDTLNWTPFSLTASAPEGALSCGPPPWCGSPALLVELKAAGMNHNVLGVPRLCQFFAPPRSRSGSKR